MTTVRRFTSTSSLILIAIGVSAIAVAVLLAFPGDPLWQIATWTLVVALVALLVLVPASAYVLSTNKDARTWQRVASFLIGLACLVAVAVGSY